MDTHTRCWRHHNVRPTNNAAEPEATNPRYCKWDRLSNGYGYTRAWVDKLVDELSVPVTYENIVGVRPDRR